jgi:hypothetical protein
VHDVILLEVVCHVLVAVLGPIVARDHERQAARAQRDVLQQMDDAAPAIECPTARSRVQRAPTSRLHARVPRLLEELRISRADGSYVKELNRLARTDVLVLDDWGITIAAVSSTST